MDIQIIMILWRTKYFKARFVFLNIIIWMYNNYEYRIIKDSEDSPNKLYNDVIGLINKNDKLLEEIYKNQKKQNNFKFCYH